MEGVVEANVYGVAVPGADGRAGMASLVVGQGFDIAELQQAADAHLPPYARPIFLRLQPEMEMTGTFKYRKIDLVEDGFDPGRISDPVYFRDPTRGYVQVDGPLYQSIIAGDIRF